MRQLELCRKRFAGAAAAVAVLAAITVATPSARADEATGTPTPAASSAVDTTTGTTTAPPTTTATRTATAQAATMTPTTPPPTTTTPPAPVPAIIGRTSSALAIKDLQVRLKLLGRFPYAITGIYWSAVDSSVLAFQQAQNLPQSRVVDQRTWDRLRALTASPTAISRKAASSSVKDLQVRLELLGRWPYAITGVYWSAVDRSVLAFQQAQNLPQSGVVDQRTWGRLRALTATPTAVPRTGAAAQVKEAQLRLRAVGRWPYAITGVYWSALDRAVLVYQQTHNLPQSGVIDQRTWSRLVADTHRPGTFDTYRFSAGLRPLMPTLASLDARCRTGRVMCVNKATRTLTWVVNGKPLMVMWARFGGPGRETREGTFSVSRKYEYVISNLYFTPMPYSMFFSGGQAVHYSSNFARLGYASSSHGCVNIADLAQVKSLYFQVRVGDKVVVRH
ncbi:peptidoglycan-binding protein [Terrabacter sp. BE26]|uniref:L,D-transpeptidase family protein n=1 Tax=Terrabacter sp. BE26 TaxID=2898152 RepID=UPI0035BE849D